MDIRWDSTRRQGRLNVEAPLDGVERNTLARAY